MATPASTPRRRRPRPAPPGGLKASMEQDCVECFGRILRGSPIVRTNRGYAHRGCAEARHGE